MLDRVHALFEHKDYIPAAENPTVALVENVLRVKRTSCEWLKRGGALESTSSASTTEEQPSDGRVAWEVREDLPHLRW